MEFFSRFISLILIIFLSPILLIIGFGNLLFQGFPIFYQQERVGFNFQVFLIYKFRTMNLNMGSLITQKNDKRITAFGNFLRKTKLDELPQLFNILKGDMRFIGPRPEVLNYFNKNEFHFLKKIKPGISDYSSILLRNEENILCSIGGEDPYGKLLPYKIKLAKYYADKKNFKLDLKLTIITIISIFMPNYAAKFLINDDLIKKIPNIKRILSKDIT